MESDHRSMTTSFLKITLSLENLIKYVISIHTRNCVAFNKMSKRIKMVQGIINWKQITKNSHTHMKLLKNYTVTTQWNSFYKDTTLKKTL